MMGRPVVGAAFYTIVKACVGNVLTTLLTCSVRDGTHKGLAPGESAILGQRTGSTR